MMAVREGNTVTIASDFVAAVAGSKAKRYSVKLHAIPKYTFIVEAENGDKAIAIAVACYTNERGKISSAATFQAL